MSPQLGLGTSLYLAMPGSAVTAASHTLAEAQKAYDAKRYQESIKLLSKLVNTSDEALRIKAIDLRIAVYVKLTKYDLALDDAKLLIRHDRSNAQGYIRCGQIEYLRRQYDAASRWYRHGLRHADSSDRLRPVLQTQLDRAQRHAVDDYKATKACDPMTYLPLEIVDMLLSYFDYKDQTALMRVSSVWKKLLSSRPPLNTRLDFARANRKVTFMAFHAAIRRLQRYPSNVVLANLDPRATGSARSYLQSWLTRSCLQEVELHGPDLVNRSSLRSSSIRHLTMGAHTTATTQDVIKILGACSGLREACFLDVIRDAHHDSSIQLELHMPLLEALTLVSKAPLGNGPALAIGPLESTTNLKSLKVHNVQLRNQDGAFSINFSGHKQLRHVELVSINTVLVLPRSVTTLNLENSMLHLDNPQELDELRTLNMYKTHYIAYDQFQGLLRTASNLANLTITLGLPDHIGEWRDYELKSFLKLQNLRIYCQDLGDNDIPLFLEWFPYVESLVLECAKITGFFIAKLIGDRPQVRHILLQDCLSVSADTVEWAHRRGVKLTMRKTPA